MAHVWILSDPEGIVAVFSSETAMQPYLTEHGIRWTRTFSDAGGEVMHLDTDSHYRVEKFPVRP